MTAIHWLNPISGTFTTPGDWSGGKVPGYADEAILDAVGSAFTVTAAGSEVVGSLQLAANATLSIKGGTFDVLAGTGSGANAGVILVGAADTLSLAGTVTNQGVITLDSPQAYNQYAALTLAAGVTLTGGGVINAAGTVSAAAGGGTITNIDNTFVANFETSFGIDSMFTENTSPTTFVNRSKGVVVSYALLLMGGTGSLSIANNGTIESADFGYVDISNTNISGAGLLAVEGTGSMQFTGSSKLKGQSISVAAGGRLFLECEGAEIAGSFHNAGSVTVSGGIGLFLTGDLTLAGGGRVSLGNGGPSQIGGHAGSTFTNVDNTITGMGAIGNGAINIVNETGGVIVANDGPLNVETRRGATIANSGLIAAYGAYGNLTVGREVINTGTIESVSSQLTVQGYLTNNGLLTVSGARARGGNLTLEGHVNGTGSAVIGNDGTLTVAATFSEAVTFVGAGYLRVAHSWSFQSPITGFSTSGGTALDLEDIKFVGASEATFSGTVSGGVLTVTDGRLTAKVQLVGDYLSATFLAVDDGHGGVTVVAETIPGSSPHGMVAAMAALGASAAVSTRVPEPAATSLSGLARPHG